MNTILVKEGQIQWDGCYTPILTFFFIFLLNNSFVKVVSWNINGCGNIYAPNKEDPSFFHEVNSILGNAQGQVILAGDLNQVLDCVLDKSKLLGTRTSTPKDRAAIHPLIEDNGLIDVWRLV